MKIADSILRLCFSLYQEDRPNVDLKIEYLIHIMFVMQTVGRSNFKIKICKMDDSESAVIGRFAVCVRVDTRAQHYRCNLKNSSSYYVKAYFSLFEVHYIKWLYTTAVRRTRRSIEI